MTDTQPTPSDAELIEHARAVGMVEPERAPEFVAAYRAHVEQQSASHAAQPVPQLADVVEEQPAPACKCGHPQERHTLLSGTYAQCRHKYAEAGRGKCRCGMYRPQAAAESTHEGPDPSHGGLTTHRGHREDCTGPDCGPAEEEQRQAAAERYPCRLGVYCDTCKVTFTGDFIVSDDMPGPARLEVVRAHVRSLGWQCDAAGDFCPECEPSAPTAEQATAKCAHVWITALDGDDNPARDHAGRTWEHCGICGTKRADVEEQQRRAAQEQAAAEFDAGTALLVGEQVTAYAAAVHSSALLAGADAIDKAFHGEPFLSYPPDFAQLLRRMAGAKEQSEPVEEQPAPLTMADRNAHAVGLYASTAVELEDARAERDRALAQRNAVFKTNEQLLAQVEEAGQARIRAENEARTLVQQRDRIAHDTMTALATPLSPAERQFLTFALDEAADEMANRDGFTDEDTAALAKFRRMASVPPEAADTDGDQAEEQTTPAALPYLHTDCDGDTLSVRAVLGTNFGPCLIITAGDSSDHEQVAAYVPVDEAPQLVAAINRAAAVARRDHDEAGR